MRKMILIFLLILLTLTACRQPDDSGNTGKPTDSPGPIVSTSPVNTNNPSVSFPPSSPEPTPEPIDFYTDPLGYLRQNMPVIDGSSSLIPLEGGIKATIFGLTQDEAEKKVAHTTTYEAFYKLTQHECDLLLTVPLSENQYADARYYNVKLEEIPIAKDGFVFVVNYDNPVDTLTQDQLRAIYSGKITNWKDVGGNDEKIIAYQRDSTSGSQNYMVTFMGDTPLIDAPTELRPGSMSGLIDIIAANDNASNTLGYSVYTYAADMYGSGKDIKFIKVDGIEPNKKTMATGEYPLMSYNYAIFNSAEEADAPVRRLVGWMTSYDGQLSIAQAGYITAKDIGFDYEEMRTKLWSGTGTGAEKSTDYSAPTYEHIAYDQKNKEYVYPDLPLNEVFPSTKTGLVKDVTYELDWLTDKTLQAEINKWISEAMVRADEKFDSFNEYIDELNADSQWPRYKSGNGSPHARVTATAKNGYLSVEVAMIGIDDLDYSERYYHIETGVWDLLSGIQLEISDLFYEGVDIAGVLNKYLKKAVQEPVGVLEKHRDIKRDFAGLTLTGWTMTADTIYFDYFNPYFGYGVAIDLMLEDGILVTEQPRDMSACFESEPVLTQRSFRNTDRNRVYKSVCDGFVNSAFLVEESYPAAKKINAAHQAMLEEHYTKERAAVYLEKQKSISFEDMSKNPIIYWHMSEYAGRFVRFYNQNGFWFENEDIPYLYPSIFYDLTTGKEVHWSSLLKEGWRTASQITVGSGKPIKDKIDFNELILTYVYNSDGGMMFCFRKRDVPHETAFCLLIPDDYIFW